MENAQQKTQEAMEELKAQTEGQEIPSSDASSDAQVQQESYPEDAVVEPMNEPNWKEEAARALAELENVRKRHQKELVDARQFAVSNFAREMLNVADNVARAQSVLPENAEGDLKTIKEGVAMVAHQFQQSLEKFKIKKIAAEGEMLNPEFHQAMQKAPSDKPEDTVIAEMQTGYMIGERLLRPALVVVSNGEKPETQNS